MPRHEQNTAVMVDSAGSGGGVVPTPAPSTAQSGQSTGGVSTSFPARLKESSPLYERSKWLDTYDAVINSGGKHYQGIRAIVELGGGYHVARDVIRTQNEWRNLRKIALDEQLLNEAVARYAANQTSQQMYPLLKTTIKFFSKHIVNHLVDKAEIKQLRLLSESRACNARRRKRKNNGAEVAVRSPVVFIPVEDSTPVRDVWDFTGENEALSPLSAAQGARKYGGMPSHAGTRYGHTLQEGAEYV